MHEGLADCRTWIQQSLQNDRRLIGFFVPEFLFSNLPDLVPGIEENRSPKVRSPRVSSTCGQISKQFIQFLQSLTSTSISIGHSWINRFPTEHHLLEPMTGALLPIDKPGLHGLGA